MTITKLTRCGSSQGISIIKTSRLEKLLKEFDGDPKDYKNLINWGNPAGKEVW